VCGALAAAGSNHGLDKTDLVSAERAWDYHWAEIRPVELTAQVERHAGQLARTHGLRGADAVHLASALVIGDPDLVFAVWDERLHPEARAAWIRFTPLDLNV
jgi:predicted nucleic acid-binding protein